MKKLIFFQVIALILLVIVFSDIAVKHALDFVIGAEATSLKSLGLIEELVIGARMGASSGIPLISGSFKAVADSFVQGSKWVEYCSMILGAQILLVTFTKTLVLKIAVIPLWIGVFIPGIRSTCSKLLIFFFLINPGLPLFINACEALAHEIDLDTGNKLQARLESNYNLYQAQEEKHQKELKELEAKQAKENGGKENIFQRLGDDVISTVHKVEDKAQLVYSDTESVLKASSKELVSEAVHLFARILTVFVLLPFGYFYFIKAVLKEQFNFNISLSPKTKTISHEN